MKYIKRNSESNIPPQGIESLQGGLLLHFNITEHQSENETEGEISTFYKYVEFWFDSNVIDNEVINIVESYGYFI